MDDQKKTTPVEAGQAFKSIAAMLATISDFPISTSENDEQSLTGLLLRWTEHFLTGRPVEGETPEVDNHDWPGFNDFFRQFRIWEVDNAEKSLMTMRDFIWEFLRAISTDINANLSDTKVINHTMEKLQTALTEESMETLKKEVTTVVQILKDKMIEREKRYSEQLAMLSRRLKHMRDELNRTKLKLATDPLTGIFNRAALDEHLHRIVDIGALSGTPTCLLMIDIDHFKEINDTHGHQIGDAVLVRLAEVLKKTFPRKSDFVARYGGEEFTVIFAEDDAKIGKMLAEKLMKSVREIEFSLDDKVKIKVTISIGVAEKLDNEAIDQWIKRADDALYQAKDLGRNMVCVA